MIEYYDLKKFVSKKADLYNFINPFFDLNYLKSINFFYILDTLQIYKKYFDNIACKLCVGNSSSLFIVNYFLLI